MFRKFWGFVYLSKIEQENWFSGIHQQNGFYLKTSINKFVMERCLSGVLFLWQKKFLLAKRLLSYTINMLSPVDIHLYVPTKAASSAIVRIFVCLSCKHDGYCALWKSLVQLSHKHNVCLLSVEEFAQISNCCLLVHVYDGSSRNDQSTCFYTLVKAPNATAKFKSTNTPDHHECVWLYLKKNLWPLQRH